MKRLLLAAPLFLTACLTTNAPLMPILATAEVSNDFDTYRIRRVGLPPFRGNSLSAVESKELQSAFLSEVTRSTPYEVVPLVEADLEMIESGDPHRRGWYSPTTVIQIAGRYSLDAIFFGSVTDERFYPPQLLALNVDLVSAETGLVIWSSTVHLDATDPRVRDGLKAYFWSEEDQEAWRLALLSPERFSRFAAYQVACLL